MNILTPTQKETKTYRYGWIISDNYDEEVYLFSKKKYDNFLENLKGDDLEKAIRILICCSDRSSGEIIENLRSGNCKEIVFGTKVFREKIEKTILKVEDEKGVKYDDDQ